MTDGKFVWLDGGPVEYFDWTASEPSGSNESFVGYYVTGPSTLKMQWADQTDYHRLLRVRMEPMTRTYDVDDDFAAVEQP